MQKSLIGSRKFAAAVFVTSLLTPLVVATSAHADAAPAPAEATAQAAPAAEGSTPDAQLNDYVRGLAYDPTLQLTSKGDSIENPPVTKASNEEGTFTVVERIKRSIQTQNSDIAAISANAAEIYPGAVVLADQNLLDNRPTVLQVPAAKQRLSIDLPGMADGTSNLDVEQPAKSSMQNGVNTLVDRWFQGPAKDFPNVASRFSYDETTAYSESQLAAKFGIGFNVAGQGLKINFEAIHNGKQTVKVASFKQVFYTVNTDTPQTPAGAFAAGTTPEQLKQAGVSETAPPAYVSSISYGRQIFLKMESSESEDKVSAAFSAAFKGVPALDSLESSAEYSKILKDSHFTAVVYGGSATNHVEIVEGSFDSIKSIIQNNGNFTSGNPGVPLSYNVRYLKDNVQAVINSNSDYVETKATKYHNGYFKVRQQGAYIAKFDLTWDEFNYDENGNEVVTQGGWDGNGQNRTAGYEFSIYVPPNARNLHFKAREITGFAWEPIRTIVDSPNLSLVPLQTYTVWGTTANPKWGVEVGG